MEICYLCKPKSEKVRMRLFALLFGIVLWGVESHADEFSVPSDSATMLGEVSVTAIKQQGPMQSQPTAVTTLGSSEVERLNIMTMKNVSEIAPNFYIPDYGSRMTSSIYVRGIGARIDQPAVGLNVDNVPYLNKDAYDFDLVDIERIEVMRGPQSTLYGRNTMAGLINIYTLSPLRYQGIRVMAEGGTGTSLKAALSGYTKINSRLGMSLSGYYNYSRGFYTNRYDNSRADRDRGASGRWKTVWRASDEVSIENVASVGWSRQDGYPYAYAETGEINYNDPCFYKRLTVNDGLTVKWVTPRFTLASITSFQYIKDNMTLDQDFLPLSYFTLTQSRNERSVTQDIVVRGSTGNYSWLAGVFGFYKQSHMNAPVTFKETGIEELIVKHRNESNPDFPIEWETPSFLLGSTFRNPVMGAALYHRSSYDLGRWNFSLGLRLDYEHTALNYYSHCNSGYIVHDITDIMPWETQRQEVVIDDRGKLSTSFTQLLPKLSVTYNFNRSYVYASIAKGYKAGGYNTQMFSDVLQQRLMASMGMSALYKLEDIVSYNPEYSLNYEAGFHACFMPQRPLDLDLALFYIDCRDQQMTVFPEGTTTGRLMTNAGRTRSVGGEVSLKWSISDDLLVRADYGYTNASFRRYNDGRTDYKGKRVPYAPSNTLFGQLTYRAVPLQFSGITPSITATARCVGSIYWNEANTARQPFYCLPGLEIGFDAENWSLRLSGSNLTGTRYDTFYFVSIGNAFVQRGLPRRFDVTFRVALR